MSRISVCISSVTGVIQGVSLSCYGVIQGVSLSCYGVIQGVSLSCNGVIQGVSLSCYGVIQGVSYGVIQGVSLSCYLRGEACQVLEKTVGDLGLDSVQVYKCTSVQVNDET